MSEDNTQFYKQFVGSSWALSEFKKIDDKSPLGESGIPFVTYHPWVQYMYEIQYTLRRANIEKRKDVILGPYHHIIDNAGMLLKYNLDNILDKNDAKMRLRNPQQFYDFVWELETRTMLSLCGAKTIFVDPKSGSTFDGLVTPIDRAIPFECTHPVTKENIPLAEKAHIYAFSEGGKRFSRLIHREKINDIANLIIVCGGCHELIDSEDTNYSANELIDMKNEHEERVTRLVSLKPDLQSEIVIYNANIADGSIKISDYVAMSSITPQYYPARSVPYKLSPDLRLYDNETDYWKVMARDLVRVFVAHEPALRDKRISLFAIAPQPLLFKLGTLLNRNYNVDVRQPQGSIDQWHWSETKKTIELVQITLPELVPQKSVVLTLELTARLSEEELRKVFSGHAVYRITCAECNPMVIKCKADLQAVMEQYRTILNKIRAERGPDVQIHLVPIAPASVTIEAGRQVMKGDPQVAVYDRNYLTKEWTKALVFNGEEDT